MIETNETKILLGNSIEAPEVDMDEKQENGDYPYQESALQDYYFAIIINNIGKKEFQENYLISKNIVISYPVQQQLNLIAMIKDKLEELYDFEIPKYLYPDNQEDINNVLEFLEFLEYDNEKFLTEIWYYLNVNNIINIDNICSSKEKQIMLEVEEQLESQYFSQLTSYFLRTYNKDQFIKWFAINSKKIKTRILLTIRKE